ncbi:DMT family transporter [Acidaminobacter sp. JC074]|uniref:DMT family transporter n=1 Tax=Acidaminobacter sp. JC074 TaxID=2530199 RepID=UPI001F0FF4F1|nr:DMT family transporter [Acidaminobacter sp. JC074]
MKNMVLILVIVYAMVLSMPINKSYKSYHLMIPAVLFSAGVIITGKFAVQHYGSYTIIFFRFLIASIILFPFAKANYTPFKLRDLPILTIIGFIGFFLYNTLIVKALISTSASNISIISALIPITTLLIETIVFKARLRRNHLIAIALSFLSVMFVITNGHILMIFEISWSKGDLLMLLGIFCISIYSIFNSRTKLSYPPLQLLLFYFIITTIISTPLALNEMPSQFSLVGTLSIIYQGVMGTGITYILIQLSLKKYGANQTLIYFNFIPIVALALSIIILGEPLSFSLIVSSILMIASIRLVFTPKAFKLKHATTSISKGSS